MTYIKPGEYSDKQAINFQVPPPLLQGFSTLCPPLLHLYKGGEGVEIPWRYGGEWLEEPGSL
jgi:hypothetical protein